MRAWGGATFPGGACLPGTEAVRAHLAAVRRERVREPLQRAEAAVQRAQQALQQQQQEEEDADDGDDDGDDGPRAARRALQQAQQALQQALDRAERLPPPPARTDQLQATTGQQQQ